MFDALKRKQGQENGYARVSSFFWESEVQYFYYLFLAETEILVEVQCHGCFGSNFLNFRKPVVADVRRSRNTSKICSASTRLRKITEIFEDKTMHYDKYTNGLR